MKVEGKNSIRSLCSLVSLPTRKHTTKCCSNSSSSSGVFDQGERVEKKEHAFRNSLACPTYVIGFINKGPVVDCRLRVVCVRMDEIFRVPGASRAHPSTPTPCDLVAYTRFWVRQQIIFFPLSSRSTLVGLSFPLSHSLTLILCNNVIPSEGFQSTTGGQEYLDDTIRCDR